MKLILVRGAPGSGKSSYGKELEAAYKQYILLEADMYMLGTKGGYVYDPSRIKDAHKWCQTTTKALLLSGKTVVVANTFTKLWEILPYLDLATKIDCPIEIIHMTSRYKSTHGVPESTIERMLEEYEPYLDEVNK